MIIRTFLLFIIILGAMSCGMRVKDGHHGTTLHLKVTETEMKASGGCFDLDGYSNAVSYVFKDHNDLTEDRSGQEEAPLFVTPITAYKDGFYEYELVFAEDGRYLEGITCRTNSGNLNAADSPEFFKSRRIFIGLISEISASTELPDGHWDASTECFGCHTLGERSDVVEFDHKYTSRVCSECHLIKGTETAE